MRTSVVVPFHRCRQNVTARMDYSPDCKQGFCYGCRKVIDLTQAKGAEQVSNVIWTYPELKRFVEQAR